MPINITLDATMLDTFIVCPEKYKNRFLLNKTTTIKAAALDKGTLIHQGLEEYYRSLQKGYDYAVSKEAALEGINVAAAESDLPDEDISFLKRVLLENVSFWRHRDQELVILAVEESFSYLLEEFDYLGEVIRVIMMGKIDLLVNEANYKNLPYDTKTYSRTSPIYRMTNQFCNYAFATGSNYLVVNRVGLQTSMKAEEKHKRIPLSYDPLFLNQWKSNVIKWAKIYADCIIENSWPLNTTSCDKYNRLCEYYEVCDSSGEEAKTYKLNTNFKTAEKWDVGSGLGLKG